jgi:4-hydroxy-tetrahydrodipicolinate reductase
VTDLVICGIRGRMGRALVELAREHADVRVVAGIGRRTGDGAENDGGAHRIVPVEQAVEVIADCDVVVDFSTSDATRALLEHGSQALAGRALVVGTTGLDAATENRLDELAAQAAVLTAANFSIGVNLLLDLCERVGAALAAEAWDVEIVEAHHNRKVDAPSGTALALGGAVARGRGVDLGRVRRDGRSGNVGERETGEIGLHAVRGGSVVGEHSVQFLGARERIELVHRASDRALFAEGALVAARWLSGRAPGRYTMRQALNL